MSRVLEAVRGMRVVTPCGLIARVQGRHDDKLDPDSTKYLLQYLDIRLGEVVMAAKLLRNYEGPAVLWPDEVAQLRNTYALARPILVRRK